MPPRTSRCPPLPAAGVEGLRKSSSSDVAYGIRVCIGGSSCDWYSATCGAGGVAYLNSFSWGTDEPTFVFPAQLGNGFPKYVWEAVSHEVGHTVGLSHDGTATTGYYSGHGDWAPIMGVGYYEPITQFSKVGGGLCAGGTHDADSCGGWYRLCDAFTAAWRLALAAGNSTGCRCACAWLLQWRMPNSVLLLLRRASTCLPTSCRTTLQSCKITCFCWQTTTATA